MGGMKCITPSLVLPPANSIKRLESVLNDEEVSKLRILELLLSNYVKSSSLQQIPVKDLNLLNLIPSNICTPCLPVILWMSGECLSSQQN
ncbi:hypothetical protein AVEN_188214-1 [Araneus ventricosus]|uniref:Uncharacterized protein n=1 Tax=Araneus ventricosus TaxID=182803 RepID=A0A4Y2HZV6_ARAVE|nr:hypothetical protein AVEN_188214-1 [Araneus ventricosus]